MLASLSAHTIPGAERTDAAAGTHERLIRTSHGPVAVSLRFDDTGVNAVLLDASTTDHQDVHDEVVAAVRHWLDLDSDVAAVRAALEPDATLAPLIAARPRLRVIGTTDAFQSAITTVLGQQVSLAAGRTFAGRLVATYGESGPAGLVQFPRPRTLTHADPDELRAAVGLTAARARTVQAVAEAFESAADAALPQSHAGALPLSRAQLLAVPGVGPWTADYLEVRTGNPDAFAPGDLVLRRALGGISAAEAAARSEAWRPFRAYALVHLWTAAAYL